MAELPAPNEGIALTPFIVSDDVQQEQVFQSDRAGSLRRLDDIPEVVSHEPDPGGALLPRPRGVLRSGGPNPAPDVSSSGGRDARHDQLVVELDVNDLTVEPRPSGLGP